MRPKVEDKADASVAVLGDDCPRVQKRSQMVLPGRKRVRREESKRQAQSSSKSLLVNSLFDHLVRNPVVAKWFEERGKMSVCFFGGLFFVPVPGIVKQIEEV